MEPTAPITAEDLITETADLLEAEVVTGLGASKNLVEDVWALGVESTGT